MHTGRVVELELEVGELEVRYSLTLLTSIILTTIKQGLECVLSNVM